MEQSTASASPTSTTPTSTTPTSTTPQPARSPFPRQRLAEDAAVSGSTDRRPRRGGVDDAEHVVRRGLGALALLGIALIHLLDLPGKLEETPYLGWAYVGLIVAAVGVAEVLIRNGSRLAWLAAGALAGSTLAGFVVNRTVGMPGATDDIGNWLEPLGMASLFVEGVVVLLAVTALARRRR